MKRPQRFYDIEPDLDGCYKMDAIHDETQNNFESVTKWLYLGADKEDSTFAKIGMTMDDMGSRSTYSGNANYYKLCAFKCDYRITKKELESIEYATLKYMDILFCDLDGRTLRRKHADGKRLSECYYGVDFDEFITYMHDFLYDNFSRYFNVNEYWDNLEFGSAEGEILDCEFSGLLSRSEIRRYQRMMVR